MTPRLYFLVAKRFIQNTEGGEDFCLVAEAEYCCQLAQLYLYLHVCTQYIGSLQTIRTANP